MEVKVRRVTVAGSFGRKSRVAAVDATTVHQLEVYVLVMGLYAKVVLKYLAASRAPAWVVSVEGHLLSADKAAVFVSRVGDETTVRVHGRCGGRGAG